MLTLMHKGPGEIETVYQSCVGQSIPAVGSNRRSGGEWENRLADKKHATASYGVDGGGCPSGCLCYAGLRCAAAETCITYAATRAPSLLFAYVAYVIRVVAAAMGLTVSAAAAV